VVQELTDAGVLVVASAGNDGGVVDSPGNCPGVVAVGAVRHIGTKVGFSNVGPGVVISAPGGNCVNVGVGQPCLFSIDTTFDLGTTTPSSPSYTNQSNINVGTSFSSPIVAGAAALMHGVNARLSPELLTARLRESARPFPTTSTTVPAPPVCHEPVDDSDVQLAECICTTTTCGAGMLDAAAAVVAAQRPAVSVQLPSNVMPGQNVTLDASGSAASCNRNVATFAWTDVSPNAPPITGASQPAATVTAPTSGSFTIRLTITDNQGAQDSADVTVGTNNASTTALPLKAGPACPTPITVAQTPPTPPPPTPPSSGGSGGGGGGGQFGSELLLLAFALLVQHSRRRIAPV
jgi:serine protease